MNILPLKLAVCEDDFSPKGLIDEEIVEKQHGMIGKIELYVFEGGEDLKGYVDQERSNPYRSWSPLDMLMEIDYDSDSCHMDGKMSYLKGIGLLEPWQGKGIGTHVLNQIIQHLKKEQVDYLILQPNPLGGSDEENCKAHEEKRKRLVHFYQTRFGFERITTKAELQYPYYYLKLSSSIS